MTSLEAVSALLNSLAHRLALLVPLGVAVICGVVFCQGLYNIFLHPLRKFPGPTLWGATRLAYMYRLGRGNLYEHIKNLHDKYGPVVRIAPDELSFSNEAAFSDIYCGGNSNKGYPKHDAYRVAGAFESVFDADDEKHTRLRRLFKNRFFSSRAARGQEVVVQRYTDLLMSQLRDHHCFRRKNEKAPGAAADMAPADLRSWFNWASLDIIGSLVCSEDFGCLEGRASHPWLTMVETYMRVSAVALYLQYFPPLPHLLAMMAPKRAMDLQKQFLSTIRQKVSRRLARTLPEGEEDLISYAMITEDGDDGEGFIKGLDEDEVNANVVIFLLAGSETVATTLLGTTHLLCEHPEVLRKLTEEVRSVASDEADITANYVAANMPYLNAVLKESMRVAPALTNQPPRVVVNDNAIIDGYYVPPGTAVGVTQWVASRSANHFVRPDEFIPERWLSAEAAVKYAGPDWDQTIFSKDVRDASRPFSIGGRDCLGQNLAWVELRVMLGRLVWNFDLEVCRTNDAKTQILQELKEQAGERTTPAPSYPAFNKWTDQDAFILWQKRCYSVWLTERLA